jgi:peptide/nickel transport system permease protein
MQNPYLEAARAMGSGHLRIVLRYVLPNVMATILILATIGLGGVILAESSLSFLGFGVPPPHPSWGAMFSGSGCSNMYWARGCAGWGLLISPRRVRLQYVGRRCATLWTTRCGR